MNSAPSHGRMIVDKLVEELRELREYRRRCYEVEGDDVDVALGEAAAALAIAQKRANELEAKAAQFVAIMELADSEGFTPEIEQALMDLRAALRAALQSTDVGGEG